VGTDRLLDIERLIGSGFNDSLTGSTGANRLDGLDGDDTLTGGDGNDDLAGGTGFDTASYAAATGPVTVDLDAFPFAFFPGFAVGPGVGSDGLRDIEAVIGSAFADSLRGDSAANRLDSGAGADTMAGGAGDDTYVVNSLLDQVTELAGAGVDSALSGISLSLYANLESLTLLGAAAIDGTGNLLANTLTGNGAGNRLLGLGGGDLLAGGAGNDTLDGGTGFDTASFLGATAALTVNLAAGTATGQGADTLSGIEAVIGGGLADTLIGDAQANRLDGQAGADSMSGGAGDDTYLVDNALDRITELAGGGADSVQSSVSLALAAEVENLTLLGSGALNGDGNPLANVLNGTAGVNRLRGGNGNDTLSAATATTGWTAEWATTPPASPARRVASSRICPPAALRGVAAGSTP
jgi:Ca2+-binding RTX toxin-like protein